MTQNRINIMVVFGTRPEAIKLAPLIRELNDLSSLFNTRICVTAQHRQLLDQVLIAFGLSPDFDLNIMKENQDLFQLTAETITQFKKIFSQEKINLIIVQGDTTSAFLASLASFYLKIPVAHLEAGLRSGYKYHPFPEEINRKLISILADYHFAPTKKARENLIEEGIPPHRIWITGNTIIDAMQIMLKRISSPDKSQHWHQEFKRLYRIDLMDNKNRLILITAHRRESFGGKLENICEAIKEIALKRREFTFIYPVHLNPNVQKPVKKILTGLSNVFIIEPLEYEAFIFLMNQAYLILTDSGGIQEEAPSMGKPVLVLRERSERPEGIEAGMAKIIGTNKKQIVTETLAVLDDPKSYKEMIGSQFLYGDGQASSKIVHILKEIFHENI